MAAVARDGPTMCYRGAMAEGPSTELVVLAGSRLVLAAVTPRSAVRPWVPALASLASELNQRSTAGDIHGEAAAYLHALTNPPHGLSYVTLDELVGTVVGLAVDPWPGVDMRGRLVFGDPAPVDTVEVDLELLQEFVAAHRRWLAERALCPAELVDQSVCIGDVYGLTVTVTTGGRRAARLDDDGPLPKLRVPAEQPRKMIEVAGLVFEDNQGALADIGWDARELAKTAYYAAMAVEANIEKPVDRAIMVTATDAAMERLTEAAQERADGRS